MGAGKPGTTAGLDVGTWQEVDVLANCLHGEACLPQLRSGSFAGGLVAMRLWIHLSWTPFARLSSLRIAATVCPVLWMWTYRALAEGMKLTPRCIDILKLLSAARWLSTMQIHRRFFGRASVDAARKRLRKLAQSRYLVTFQENRMSEIYFGLGSGGKRWLATNGSREVALERRPPRQLSHFSGINDIRIAAELSGALSYFFACWELPALNWPHPIIPDAVFAIHGKTLAVEFDRGQESTRFFKKTKVALYQKGLAGLPISTVIIVADRKARMATLAHGISDDRGKMLFTTLDLVQKHGLSAPMFCARSGKSGNTLVCEPLLADSPVGRRASAGQVIEK